MPLSVLDGSGLPRPRPLLIRWAGLRVGTSLQPHDNNTALGRTAITSQIIFSQMGDALKRFTSVTSQCNLRLEWGRKGHKRSRKYLSKLVY